MKDKIIYNPFPQDFGGPEKNIEEFIKRYNSSEMFNFMRKVNPPPGIVSTLGKDFRKFIDKNNIDITETVDQLKTFSLYMTKPNFQKFILSVFEPAEFFEKKTIEKIKTINIGLSKFNILKSVALLKNQMINRILAEKLVKKQVFRLPRELKPIINSQLLNQIYEFELFGENLGEILVGKNLVGGDIKSFVNKMRREITDAGLFSNVSRLTISLFSADRYTKIKIREMIAEIKYNIILKLVNEKNVKKQSNILSIGAMDFNSDFLINFTFN